MAGDLRLCLKNFSCWVVALERLMKMGAGKRELSAKDKVVTIPNIITVFRAGVTIGALWLLMEGQSHTVIFGCLAFAAFLDGVDGYAARRLNQISRLGTILDPALDKLLMIAMATVFWISDIIPVWLAAVLVARDIAMVTIAAIAIRMQQPVVVSMIGKLGNLLLSLGLPGFLLTEYSFSGAIIIRMLGICFTAMGLLLYYWSLSEYVKRLVRAAP